MTGQAGIPITLYLHLPFCIRKCPYCDFHSLPDRLGDESAYVARLIEELRHWRSFAHGDGRPLHAIFFGGGTPSLLNPAAIQTILDAVRTLWPLEPGCEITLEANPESCPREKMPIWREAGINRVSLGIQALDDERLRLLGRPHDRERALDAVQGLLEAGFSHLNADLIYATPGQTLEAWEAELREAVGLGLGHLSGYALTLEEGTAFQRRYDAGRMVMPDEGLALEFLGFTRRFLAGHGYDPYEVSNFAKPGQACRHNRNYWAYGDYLGIGSGAHGKWRDEAGVTWRWANSTDLTGYLHGSFATPEPLSRREVGMECVMMGLRMAVGVDRAGYRALTGVDLVEARGARVWELVEAGLLEVDEARVRVTEAGVACLDAIVERLTG
ncbi:Heme chaperone HemW [Candidatus Magnetaquicoccaceae bacterium FCR-1]|uniref:Heme chaperone HemW n=1 Tax=Candidatus Magnetaquiglobus chichijimensis TaxID=3141448 RepID=A0ABQ0C6P9_9PROT